MIDWKPQFKVGQVVRFTTDYYLRGKKRGEQYQCIVAVFPWSAGLPLRLSSKSRSFGYKFLNGDECNERFIRALNTREIGTPPSQKEKP